MRIIVVRNDPRTMHNVEVGEMHEGTAIDSAVAYHNFSLCLYNLRQKAYPSVACSRPYFQTVFLQIIASIRFFVFDTIGCVQRGVFQDKTQTLQLL